MARTIYWELKLSGTIEVEEGADDADAIGHCYKNITASQLVPKAPADDEGERYFEVINDD